MDGSSSCTRRLWPRPSSVPPGPKRAAPIGMPPSASPAWASSIATASMSAVLLAVMAARYWTWCDIATCGRVAAMELADFDALSFDCYGTLIDWEAGLAAVLGPWARSRGLDLSDEALLTAYSGHESRAEAGH